MYIPVSNVVAMLVYIEHNGDIGCCHRDLLINANLSHSTMLHRSGKSHISYDKFSCWKIFVGMTPYHVTVNSVYALRLIFIAAIDYENIFTMNI